MKSNARAPDGVKKKNQSDINFFLIRKKMKRLFLLSIFALLFKWGVAQEYETIVDTTKQWAVVQYWFYDDEPFEDRFAAYTTGYRFRGDTLINNYHYKFLEESKDSIFENWYRSPYLMRDDSNGRIFIHNYKKERLYVDLNMEIGDTIWLLSYNNFDDKGYMEIIDSIGVTNIAGKERNTLFWWFDLPLFIQGFGTYEGPLGLFYHNNLANCSWYVTCFQQNNEMLYQSEDSCYIHFDYTSISDLKDKLDVHIYPNPASNVVSFAFNNPSNENASLSIFDIAGNLIFEMENYCEHEPLSLINIPNGIYMYAISFNNTYYKGKFVIAR